MTASRMVAVLALATLVCVGGVRADEYAYAGQWGSEGGGAGEFTIIGGIAEADGIVYVTDFVDAMTCRIQTFDHDGNFVGSVTAWGEARGATVYTSVVMCFEKLDLTGQVYFAVEVDDLTGRTLFQPSDFAVDSAGHVYVAECAQHQVNKFAGDGTFIDAWGSFGDGSGQLNFVGGVAVGPGDIVYLSDMMNGRVQRFDTSGQLLGEFGEPGTGPGQFMMPMGLTLDSAGNTYVVDAMNWRIQKFDPSGAFMTAWGAKGSGDAQFELPADVAVTPDGSRVFVADRMNHRVQRFDRQ